MLLHIYDFTRFVLDLYIMISFEELECTQKCRRQEATWSTLKLITVAAVKY